MSEKGSREFLNQQPFTVTEEDLCRNWGGYRDGRKFRCAWCGHRFRAGDVARWVFTNSERDRKGVSGNPFICQNCDGPHDEILDRLAALVREANGQRFWWARKKRHEDDDR